MTRILTWLKLLLVLLVFPAVAGGSVMHACGCDRVAAQLSAECGCGHHHSGGVPGQGDKLPQLPEHDCFFALNDDLQIVPDSVEPPAARVSSVELVPVPDFQLYKGEWHSLVAHMMERCLCTPHECKDAAVAPLLI